MQKANDNLLYNGITEIVVLCMYVQNTDVIIYYI